MPICLTDLERPDAAVAFIDNRIQNGELLKRAVWVRTLWVQETKDATADLDFKGWSALSVGVTDCLFKAEFKILCWENFWMSKVNLDTAYSCLVCSIVVLIHFAEKSFIYQEYI